MLQSIINSGAKLSPMMIQYTSVKKEFPDDLLFFRMGDFYELFFDDAKLAAKLLNITLTHRGKIGDIPIPMAGVPHHSVGNYIDRITSQGMKVVICEQVEDPKDSKGIVKRKVTQIVSPGMPYDIERGNLKEMRYMASCYANGQEIYLILLEFSTGDFIGYKLKSETEFLDKLKLHSPKELITHIGQFKEFPAILNFLKEKEILKTFIDKDLFCSKNGSIYIQKLIPFYDRDEVILQNKDILPAISALSFYITSNQSLDELCHIRPFHMESENAKMRVTLSTLIGLEILPKNHLSYKESLLGYMDRTCTAIGGRKIRIHFQRPIRTYKILEERYRLITYFLQNNEKLVETRKELSKLRDLERILTKITTRKVTLSDLINLKEGICTYVTLTKILKGGPNPILNIVVGSNLEKLAKLALKIADTFNEEINASLEKGNLIKPGVSAERDRFSRLTTDTVNEILTLEEKYRKQSKINNLKIKSNNVFGYFIEVSKSHLNKVLKTWERRQTLVGSERYVTKELVKFEKEVLLAKERLGQLERKIFNSVIDEVKGLANIILEISSSIGLIDIYQSLAQMAFQDNLVRPYVHKEGKLIDVKGGWHPLIKSVMRDPFVPHNLYLDEKHYFGLITGPNMAGKTTVMREMAIIQFLMQIGSFVPAKQANLGLCDAIFSRLGASDDIMRGQSTFMVEMSEMALILRHATSKSLIVIDEVGRGTSTYDGLSIAWSIVEHLVKKSKALTLFSTHYHELIKLVEGLVGAKNFSVETSVKNGEVRFFYRLLEGGTSGSYGIYVAKLAGLPRSLLIHSQKILSNLESNEQRNSTKKNKGAQEVQLCFFPDDQFILKGQETSHIPYSENVVSKLEKELASIDIMNITPLQAMEKLQHLQKNHLDQ